MNELFGCDASCWQIWASIATIALAVTLAVSMVAVLVTLVLGLNGVNNRLAEASRTRTLAALSEANRLLEFDEEWLWRRWPNGRTNDPAAYSREECAKIEQIIGRMDSVGYLLKNQLIPGNLFLGQHFRTVLEVWKKANGYVMLQRSKRQDEYWASNFKWLADQAEAYRAKNHPGLEIQPPPEIPGKEANLLSQLQSAYRQLVVEESNAKSGKGSNVPRLRNEA